MLHGGGNGAPTTGLDDEGGVDGGARRVVDFDLGEDGKEEEGEEEEGQEEAFHGQP